MNQRFGERARSESARRVPHSFVVLALALMALASVVLLAACGTPSAQHYASGVYANAAYHFSLTYPDGWNVNVMPSPTAEAGGGGAPIPLTVVVTRSGSLQEASPLVSNLTIAILDLRNPQAVNADLLHTVKSRSTSSAYHAVPLAGHTAYATQPQQQTIYGTQQTETHTDYYLLTQSFEYHVSTDVLAGDQADQAIAGMLASFTLT